MYFLRDEQERTGVLVLVDRSSTIVHFTPVSTHDTAETTAKIFIDLFSDLTACLDCDPILTSAFWAE